MMWPYWSIFRACLLKSEHLVMHSPSLKMQKFSFKREEVDATPVKRTKLAPMQYETPPKRTSTRETRNTPLHRQLEDKFDP